MLEVIFMVCLWLTRTGKMNGTCARGNGAGFGHKTVLVDLFDEAAIESRSISS